MTHHPRLAHVNKMLDRYHAQLVGLENAKLTAGAEEKVRLDQRIEDLREEMRPYEEELSRLSPPVSSATSPTPPIVTPMTPSAVPISEPLSVFISYSHKDEDLKNQLLEHLSALKREGKIRPWQDRDIEVGTEWDASIKQQLESAEIILLLISSGFLASDYCFDLEMKQALKRHEQGTATVIPIIMRPCDWKNTDFSKLQGLPTNTTAITKWDDRDEAFLNVVKGIRRAVESLQAKKGNPVEPVKTVDPVVTPEPEPNPPVSPPRSNLDEVRRNVLKKNYDRLLRQYQATAEKAELTLNPGDKIKLEEEANNLWQQLEKVDQELRQLDR